jgi:hypothetical protein
MPATAAARRVAATPARRSTANRSALRTRPAQPQRRRGNTPITGFVPVAVGATAGAIGGIADSGFVVRLTRGRLWIGALATLLVGIVALNVMALSFNASSSKLAAQGDELKRANSALQAQLAGELSREQVIGSAARMGLLMPEPFSVRHLRPSPGDAAAAAQRLRSGELTLGAETAPVTAVPMTDPVVDPTVTDPAATAAVTTPVAPAPVASTDPAATGAVAP